MQRTNVVELKPNKKQEKILKECMLLSSCVYNITNFKVRQQFFLGEKVSNFLGLQQKVQCEDDYQRLGRSYALPRIQVYAETNSARFKLIKSKSQKSVGLPKYYKNRKTNTTLPSYLVFDGCQYCVGELKVTLPLSRQLRKEYGIKQFKIAYNGILKWVGKQQRGQIHFKDGKFYLYQAVEVAEFKQVESEVYAGLDLGIKKHLGVFVNNNRELIVGSKRFYSHWLYLSSLIFAEQEALAKIGRKSSNNLQLLFSKRNKYQDNLFNNIVAKLFKFLRRQNVSILFVGNLKDIRDDNDWGCKGNKMLHNYWAFDKLLHKIRNLAEQYGIRMILTTEEYTSRTCPICYDDSKNNKKDRIFVCSYCGFVDHRDIVGAKNILYKGMHDLFYQSVHWQEILPFEVVT